MSVKEPVNKNIKRKKVEKNEEEILLLRKEIKQKKNIKKAVNELSHDIAFLLHAINIFF